MKQSMEPHLSKVVPGTLLDSGCTSPVASFLPAGSPMGMEEEGCKESPGCGMSLTEEPGITADTALRGQHLPAKKVTDSPHRYTLEQSLLKRCGPA